MIKIEGEKVGKTQKKIFDNAIHFQYVWATHEENIINIDNCHIDSDESFFHLSWWSEEIQ